MKQQKFVCVCHGRRRLDVDVGVGVGVGVGVFFERGSEILFVSCGTFY